MAWTKQTQLGKCAAINQNDISCRIKDYYPDMIEKLKFAPHPGDVMNPKQTESMLDNFASAADLALIADAAGAILRAKLVNKVRMDPRFDVGLNNCINIIRTPAQEVDRLRALAILYRLGASSKPVLAKVRGLVKPYLLNQLPPLESLEDGMDRYYAAQCIFDAEGPWVVRFAARGIAWEETAETARMTLATSLFQLVPLSNGLSQIAAELTDLQFGTGVPALSAAKRLRRVIAAIRPAIVSQPIQAGNDLGGSLKFLITSPFQKCGAPPHGSVLNSLAGDCCGLLVDILRTQLSVITDHTVYKALSPVREWLTPSLWTHFMRTNGDASRALTALKDAILLLAKQRVTDQSLMEALQMLSGSREEAMRISSDLAERNPELVQDVRDWLLRYGRVRQTPLLKSFVDADEMKSDEVIATILLTADTIKRKWHESNSIAAGQTDRASAEKLISQITTLASLRKLSQRLTQGDIVSYSPSAHELVGGHELGIRKVRVLSPLVERHNTDGLIVIIMKALVEPVEN